MKNIINKIELMIVKANTLNEGSEKDLLLAKIRSYITYMFYTKNISNQIYLYLINKVNDDFRQDKIDYFSVSRNNYLLKNNNYLKNYYEEILNIYERYDIDYIDDYCDYHNISREMNNFFKKLKIDKLYNHLLHNEMIGKNKLLGQVNLTLCNYDDSYVVIGDFSNNSLLYYSLFVHEMGHVLVNSVLKEKRLYSVNSIYAEIIPVLLEKMFIDFLDNNKNISELELRKLKINEEAIRYYETVWADDTCYLIRNNEFELEGMNIVVKDDLESEYHNLYNHYYVLANIVAFNLLKEYQRDNDRFINNLSNIIEKISNMTLKDLYKKYYDKNLIDEYLNKNHLKKIIKKK